MSAPVSCRCPWGADVGGTITIWASTMTETTKTTAATAMTETMAATETTSSTATTETTETTGSIDHHEQELNTPVVTQYFKTIPLIWNERTLLIQDLLTWRTAMLRQPARVTQLSGRKRRVLLSDDLGVPATVREAMAMANLGALRTDGVSITLEQVTR